MHCGQALTPAPEPASPDPTLQRPSVQHPSMQQLMHATAAIPLSSAFDAQRRRNRTVAAVGVLFALIVAVFGLQASGFLHKFASSGNRDSLAKSGGSASASLQKNGQIAPPTLEKMAEIAPPTLDKSASRIVMPDDIKDWLEHLHKTEVARVNLTNGQIAQGMVEKEGLSVGGGIEGVKSALDGIDDPNSQLKSPVDSLAVMLKQMHDQCADLQKSFDSYPAPAECIPIQAAYDQTLGETTASLGDISDHLSSGDINKLQSMQGVSVQGIDSSSAKADRLAGEICDKYDTKKWFSITKDISPGGVFAMPGL